ncbi:MAG: hypothetical protein Q9196_004049 [Gyalolechia fulgens]
MPCFKGLAVSIHTPEGPLPEYSIQRQSRFSRISAYIPVPPAKIPRDSLTNRPEQSTFAISITLLTPGLNVPYSQPAPTPEDPYPRARIVGGLPSATAERGRYSSAISPYVPLTTSPNETVAAYIYFDGRAKEEVATLLRRGEETWVNSRWVGVPESEGGGLAEREFLFREVGLERWLNGLDLQGKDAPARIDRRRQKMEKRRRRRKIKTEGSDDEADRSLWGGTSRGDKGVLRYGTDQRLPLERLSDEDDMFLSGSETDDEPIPEAAGQIKIALFRVLASGEIRRGEYSPQFDAHDDDDESTRGENGANPSGESEEAIDHTTSFAKPKTLDPKSISTQIVTGIDGPDKPFAVFTFLYRGKKQLERMNILPSPKSQITTPELVQKRKSQPDPFAGLKPLKPGGARGYADYRDPGARSTSTGNAQSKASKTDSDMDSDEDEDIGGRTPVRTDDGDSKGSSGYMLSPEDAKDQEEVAEGVKRIRLKRQHSAEPPGSGTTATRKSPGSNSPTAGSTPPHVSGLATTPPMLLPSTAFDFGSARDFDSGTVGSPLKRARASVSGQDEEATRKHLGLGLVGTGGGAVTAAAEETKPIKKEGDENEELRNIRPATKTIYPLHLPIDSRFQLVMLSLKLIFAALMAGFVAAQNSTTNSGSGSNPDNTNFNPNTDVDRTQRTQWCADQTTNCPKLCGGMKFTKENRCVAVRILPPFVDSLYLPSPRSPHQGPFRMTGGETNPSFLQMEASTDYSCVCSNNTSPDFAAYANTYESDVCQARFAACRTQNPGSENCVQCGTLKADDVPASTSSSAAASTAAATSMASGTSEAAPTASAGTPNGGNILLNAEMGVKGAAGLLAAMGLIL